MKDYRVRVYVDFDLDVPGETPANALFIAKNIVQGVFKQSFGRADCVTIDPRCPRLVVAE